MWKPWQSSLNLCPILCIRCSCMLWINYNSVKKKAFARITDIHCTITEMQARPLFYFMMQMFIRNESLLLGTRKQRCDVPALLSRCQMRRSQFNVFMTTVKSLRSHSVSISPRSAADHRSTVFHTGSHFQDVSVSSWNKISSIQCLTLICLPTDLTIGWTEYLEREPLPRNHQEYVSLFWGILDCIKVFFKCVFKILHDKINTVLF